MPNFTRTWYAPGDNLNEWRAIQVPAGTTDRLRIVPAPLGKSANALRVEVRDGDVAVNSKGQPIPSGWRAEGVGPEELQSGQTVRFTWSTMLDSAYPVNAVGTDGKAIWQVITQWHQGDNDVGVEPPIAFIIVGDEIRLHLHKSDPQNPSHSIEVGQFPVAVGLARGSWHDFQMDVRWDLSNGWVTIWHNGQLMQHHSPIQTLFPQQQNPGVAGSTYLKMGLYRKAVPTATPGNFVLYHDEAQRFQSSFTGDRRQWLHALYADLLSRVPDPVGLGFWIAQLDSGQSLQSVANGFLESSEYCTKIITSLYQQLLSRAPDAAGLAAWVSTMENGTGLQQIVLGFCNSPEYRSHHPPPEQFVESLYERLLGRASDPVGKQGWINALQAGHGTAYVINGFLVSQEYCNNMVTSLYLMLLGRQPDAAGLAGWVTSMAGGTPFQQIQLGFLTSVEYQTRALTRFP